MPYIKYESELFSKQWKDLCKKDKPLEDRFTEVVKAIVLNPENFDGTLKGDRAGSLKKKAVGNHYRLIYRYCKRCLQVDKKRCVECESSQRDADSVIFEEVFHRNDDY
jgi:mRNA-degrading endonuclease RelE of RelBE toxin-antitoxin system